MYLAKTSGRDRYALFTPHLVQQATERLDLEQPAPRGDALRGVVPGLPAGASALGRCRALVREPGPLAAPHTRAARSGRSCRSPRPATWSSSWTGTSSAPAPAAVAWGDRPDSPSVSVNVSVAPRRPRSAARLVPGARDTGLAGNGFKLELTETALLGMTPTAQAELDTLVHLGVTGDRRLQRGLLLLKHLVDVPASSSRSTGPSWRPWASRRRARRRVRRHLAVRTRSGVSVVAEASRKEPQRGLLSSLGCTYGRATCWTTRSHRPDQPQPHRNDLG